ncbi:hypothetical protein Trydic_g21047, partial [Trypoxylus dichotomus]
VEFAAVHDLIHFVGEYPHHHVLDILIKLDKPVDLVTLPSNSNLRYNFRRVNVPTLCSQLNMVESNTLLDYSDADCAL